MPLDWLVYTTILNLNLSNKKAQFVHVSTKLITISRLTKSISEPAFILTMSHAMFPDEHWVGQQRGHLSAHASEGQCVEYANREILAELKI